MERQVRALWSQHQQKPVRKLRHAWRLRRLFRTYDLPPFDEEGWRWTFARGLTPACDRCQDNCCKGPHNTVLLRLVDVARFVDRGWTAHFTHQKPTFSEEQLAQKPLLRAMVNSFYWQVFPVLKQKEDTTCALLCEQGRCTIHADRPWVCRTFPYMLDIDAREVSWSPRCQWTDEGQPEDPVPQELSQAIFHNYYTEKYRDLILLKVYREELDATGVTEWLQLP